MIPHGNRQTQDRCHNGTTNQSLEYSFTGVSSRFPATSAHGFGTIGKDPNRCPVLWNSWNKIIRQASPMPTSRLSLQRSFLMQIDGQTYSKHREPSNLHFLFSSFLFYQIYFLFGCYPRKYIDLPICIYLSQTRTRAHTHTHFFRGHCL